MSLQTVQLAIALAASLIMTFVHFAGQVNIRVTSQMSFTDEPLEADLALKRFVIGLYNNDYLIIKQRRTMITYMDFLMEE